MTALELLITLIKDSEGCRLKAYRCPAGILTCGWGITGHGITETTVWTQEQADAFLQEAAMVALSQAMKASPSLSQATIERQAAVADFIYNLGIGHYIKSTFRLRVDQANWRSAALEVIKWNKSAGRVLKGLKARRQKEVELLLA